MTRKVFLTFGLDHSCTCMCLMSNISGCSFAGKMDDVLDCIRLLHYSRNTHGYRSFLVSILVACSLWGVEEERLATAFSGVLGVFSKSYNRKLSRPPPPPPPRMLFLPLGAVRRLVPL